MTSSIESVLQGLSRNKKTEHHLIATISKDMNKSFDPVKNIILGGGNKKSQSNQLSKAILSGAQITTYGQSREEKIVRKSEH